MPVFSGENMATAAPTAPIDFEGSKVKTILKLAAPTVVAMLLQSIVNEVDDVFFARLPDATEASNAQAALFPSLVIVWAFGGALGAISVGTQALTARRVAEGNRHAAGAVLANAVWFTLIGGLLMMPLSYFLLPFLFRNEVDGVREICIAYTRFRIFGFVSMAMTQAIKGFFDGIGRTRYHLVASLVMNVFNVLFCWIFLFGHAGVPAMGAPGAGLAALASTWIGLGIMLWYGWQHRSEFDPLHVKNLSRSLLWDMLKLSIPAALATIIMMAGFKSFEGIVSGLDRPLAGQPVGEAVNGAATTNIIEILKLTFTACIGFGTATATLVSQCMGRKDPERAEQYGWTSVRLGLVIFGVVGLCEGVLFRTQLLQFIAPKSEAVQAAMSTPMLLMGIVTPLISVALILSEALFGAGATKFVAIAQFVLITFILVPGAHLLGVKFGMGLVGIWIPACVYAALAATTMSIKFRAGGWKHIKL